jgi:NAD(P)H-dependent FMN reductase
MSKPTVLAFAGSLRAGSYNKKLVRIAAQGARNAGAHVTEIDLREFPMPIYDGDLEVSEGMPEQARRLRALFVEHQGFLIASPEYNSGMSAALKNAIDWVSRPQPDVPSLIAFRNKVVALMAASPGALGGIRALPMVRQILSNVGAIVLPTQIAVGKAAEVFAVDGRLMDDKQRTSVEALGADLVNFLTRLNGA